MLTDGDRARMQHQVAVGTGGDAPVQAPFEHRKGVLDRVRIENLSAIDLKQDLTTDKPPNAAGRQHADVVIHDMLTVQQGFLVEESEQIDEGPHPGLDPDTKRPEVNYRPVCQ